MSKGMDIKKLNEFLAGGKTQKDVPVVAQDKRCDCGCAGCQDSAGSEAGIAVPAEAMTDVGGKVPSKKPDAKAKKYLEMVNSNDAAVDLTKLALSGWKNPVSPSLRPIQNPKAKTPIIQKEKTLEEHDKRWHGGHYDGGACKYREEHGIETTPKGVDVGAKADDLKGSEQGANKGHGAHPRKMYPYVKKQFPGDKIEKSLADLVQKHVNSDFDYDVKNAFPDGAPDGVSEQAAGLLKYYKDVQQKTGGNLYDPVIRDLENMSASSAPEKKSEALIWEGNLSDKDVEEIQSIGDKMFDDIGDDVYASMGDDGRIVQQNGKKIREVSSKDLGLDDVMKETIIDELPDDASGFDKNAFVKNVASKMNQYIKDFVSWEDLSGKGREYEDDVD